MRRFTIGSKHLTSLGATLGACLGAAIAGGCFSAELNDRLGDAFACDENDDDDDDDDECPDGMSCVDSRCRIEEDIPIVEIVSPENGDDFMLGGLAPLGLDGNVKLVPEGGEHVFGEGHVVILLDGEEDARLEGGSLTRTLDIPTQGGLGEGAHRIAVKIMRNDGEPYTHEGATATRLVFGRDAVRRIAIVSPWPGTEIPADATEIDVTVATLNFIPGMPETGADGHIHIFSDEDVPSCAPTNTCTREPAVYSALFGGDPDHPNVASGSLTLPTDDREELTISTMLVTDLHNALDPNDPTIQTGTSTPVFDEVVVKRASD